MPSIARRSSSRRTSATCAGAQNPSSLRVTSDRTLNGAGYDRRFVAIEDLRIEARYHRERYDLHRASCGHRTPRSSLVPSGRLAPRRVPATARIRPREHCATGRAAGQDCRFRGGAAVSTCASAARPEQAPRGLHTRRSASKRRRGQARVRRRRGRLRRVHSSCLSRRQSRLSERPPRGQSSPRLWCSAGSSMRRVGPSGAAEGGHLLALAGAVIVSVQDGRERFPAGSGRARGIAANPRGRSLDTRPNDARR